MRARIWLTLWMLFQASPDTWIEMASHLMTEKMASTEFHELVLTVQY